MAPGKGRLGGILVATAAVLAIALGFASTRATDGAGAAPSAGPPAATANTAKRLLLRLHDLPLGYLLLDLGSPEQTAPLFGCTRLVPADPRPRLASFLERFQPRGCLAVYLRLFQDSEGGPAPLFVGTAAADLGSVEAAKAGMTVSRELLAHLTDDELPQEAPPPETIGEQTRLFRWNEHGIFFSGNEANSIVVWRWGGSLGLVVVGDTSTVAADRAAIELARRQQKHLETPTPYTPAEREDTEVALEDPALEVPVYWLGSTFGPVRGLPRLRLAQTFSTTRANTGGARVGLLYTDHLSFDRAEMVELFHWTPQQWKSLRAKEDLPFEMQCAKPHKLDLPHGKATVYVGQRPGWRCGERGPKAYAAVIRFPGVVITAERDDTCEDCSGRVDRPYNSFKGMATIARGLALRQRPQPAFSPVAAP
jgi:hypothetical protein